MDQLRQRVLHGEQGGLGPVGALQVPSGSVEHLRTQVDTQLLAKPRGAFIEVLGEHRLGLVEAASHSDVLSTLPRERGKRLASEFDSSPCDGLADEDVVVLGARAGPLPRAAGR